MNILFFLTPKANVTYIYNDFTIRQALEKMEHHKYSAVPILTKAGEYVGTLTEGDLLWEIKNRHFLSAHDAENVPVMSVPRRMDNKPVSASTNIEDLMATIINQNFVPVIDDRNIFIGIVTRKDIIRFYYDKNTKEYDHVSYSSISKAVNK